ncbi:MAG: hypothetical protein H0W37_00370 [Pseudonocardiales bacterium]|nr:hypothetical protein [Pseudonocardiales bacterium]
MPSRPDRDGGSQYVAALAGDQPGGQAALHGGTRHAAGEQPGDEHCGEIHGKSLLGVGQV